MGQHAVVTSHRKQSTASSPTSLRSKSSPVSPGSPAVVCAETDDRSSIPIQFGLFGRRAAASGALPAAAAAPGDEGGDGPETVQGRCSVSAAEGPVTGAAAGPAPPAPPGHALSVTRLLAGAICRLSVIAAGAARRVNRAITSARRLATHGESHRRDRRSNNK